MNRSLLHALNWLLIIASFCLMVFGASMGRADALDDLKSDVRMRIAFKKMGWTGDKYAPAGTMTPGNCLTFARTVQADAAQLGIGGTIGHCILSNGQQHAFFRAADGRVADIRLRDVGTEADVGCERMLSDIQ